MARDKAAQAERVAWERAAQDMRKALIGFAKEDLFVRDLAAGLGLFWQDRYTTDTIHLMSLDESLRFSDWFTHDVRMQHVDRESAEWGKRLIEIYRQQMSDVLTDKESALLDGWIATLPSSAFVLSESDADKGLVVLDDLFLRDRRVSVSDSAAASNGEVGQILLARPLPEHERVRLSGATVMLPASEREGLASFLQETYRAYIDEQGAAIEEKQDAHRVDFLRERGYLLTHYALEWAEREGRYVISADDPDARRPGGQSVRKLIRWSTEHVSSR
jgi:hypothetical protein